MEALFFFLEFGDENETEAVGKHVISTSVTHILNILFRSGRSKNKE